MADGRFNVLGGALLPCSLDPLTGFLRDGCCAEHAEDPGQHTVCTRVTDDFLSFSREQGNDLSTPRPEYGFSGLRPGDHWCVCAARWIEALLAGHAPPIVLAATDEAILDSVSLETLVAYAVDRP
ncbi:DUF2237 family protein [Jeongeupia chitinilytica]|uniref:DUF2237 domain-containing protein n=1 Tax=Jeongeupia chitinilytica TaxID=1041641 RepID=A0ABQ3H396_9NEIS|nr:DUF2237 domain-containing protein [Jeongeupia chitinilytica]GHD68319.1 hypothetical protein GCM10007350_33290 [Jeongeupia chitinilytica]